MKWESAIESILEAEGIKPEQPCPNGQTAAEFIEGAIMGALDEIEEADDNPDEQE